MLGNSFLESLHLEPKGAFWGGGGGGYISQVVSFGENTSSGNSRDAI